MNIGQAIALCDRITYKRGWAIEAQHVRDMLCIRLSFNAECAVTGKSEIQVCSTHTFPDFVLQDMSEQGFYNKMLWVFRQAEEHELREFFKVDGVAIYDPHKGEGR